MAYASGKKAWGISDRSGFRYRLREMKREWTGALVGPDEFEPKHPQLFPTPKVTDPQALRNPRPEQDLTGQRDLQYGFRPVGFRDIPGVTPPNALVANGQVGTVGFPQTVVVTGSSLTTGVGSSATSISITGSASGSSASTSVGSVTVVI